MNTLSTTAAFFIDGREYHCRELPAQFQTSPEHRASQATHKANQFRTYYASTCGHVLSATPDGKGRVLKTYPSTNDERRHKLELRVNGKKIKQYVSRLIALTFLDDYGTPDPDGDPRVEANHIDANPMNNAVSNLHWTSQKENRSHYVDHLPRWIAEGEEI